MNDDSTPRPPPPPPRPDAGHPVHEVFGDAHRSPLEKYALLAVGTKSPGALILYELVTLLFGWIPGAAGYGLRRVFYPLLFKSVGRGVTFGRNLTVRGARNISIGNDVFIDDFCVLDARGESASIRVGDRVLIARNTIVRAREGEAVIDDGADIGCNCIVGTDSRVRIGRDVLMAAYAYVVAGGNHNTERTDVPILHQGTTSRGGIEIGDGCWIGTRVTVLDGCTVGEGSVVGAHALVTRSVPSRSVAVGAPAAVVRER